MNKCMVLVSTLAFGLAGCESTTLQRDPATHNNSLGSYALPKASLSVAVYYARDSEADGLIVAAETPQVVTGEILPLTAKFSPWSKDKYRVEVDPKTGFLKKISINLDDRGPEIVKAAAESLGAIASLNPGFFARTKSNRGAESAIEAKPELVQIAEAVFDPTDAASVRAANLKLWSDSLDYMAYRDGLDCRADQRRATEDAKWVRAAVDKAKGAKAKAAARKAALEKLSATPPPMSLCHQVTRLLPPVAANLSNGRRLAQYVAYRPFVEAPEAFGTAPDLIISADGEQVTAGQASSAQVPCSGMGTSGVCVRPARELRIALKAPAGPTKWRTARLPAIGAESLVNLDRAIMADKSLSMDFVDGTPGDREVSQDSAAENFVSLPKVALDAAIDSLGKTTTALSNIIPLRIEYRSLRRPDEEIELPSDDEETAGTDDAAAGAAEGTSNDAKPAAAPVAAALPAPTPSTTTVSVPGSTGATTITIAAAAPAAKEDPAKPAAADTGPKLWFASCAYGLLCKGTLDEQISKGRPGTSELPQVDAAAGVKGESAARAQPAGQASGGQQNQDAAKPKCTTAEELKKPECKAVTG